MKEYHQEEKSESEAKEPVMEYVASPALDEGGLISLMDYDDDSLSAEEMDAQLEAFFAEQRELQGNTPIPEGYYTVEEVYRSVIKKLEEYYAQKEGHIYT
jgi:hypothetical protein